MRYDDLPSIEQIRLCHTVHKTKGDTQDVLRAVMGSLSSAGRVTSNKYSNKARMMLGERKQ